MCVYIKCVCVHIILKGNDNPHMYIYTIYAKKGFLMSVQKKKKIAEAKQKKKKEKSFGYVHIKYCLKIIFLCM